jgi:hypothetical protein
VAELRDYQRETIDDFECLGRMDRTPPSSPGTHARYVLRSAIRVAVQRQSEKARVAS